MRSHRRESISANKHQREFEILLKSGCLVVWHVPGPGNNTKAVVIVLLEALALLFAREELKDELEDLRQWLSILQVSAWITFHILCRPSCS